MRRRSVSEFLFTRSADADAPRATTRPTRAPAAAFPSEARHRSAFAGQPGKHVVELREFDLQLSFAAARMTRKNIQDQLRAVDHAALCGLFDVALLHG